MSVFVNDGGIEKEAKMIYVNDGGIDKLVAGGGIEPDLPFGKYWFDFGIQPFPGEDQVVDLAFGDGVWVAVGANGNISTSFDRFNWTPRDGGFGTNSVNCVHYADGLWVAAGGAGRIVTSSDGGVTWAQRASGTDSTIHGLHYANGLWVATATNQRILTSPNGLNWTLRVDRGGSSLHVYYAVTYANGLWVAGGGQTNTNGVTFETSPDGINWTLMRPGIPNNVVRGITFAFGEWFVCCWITNGGRVYRGANLGDLTLVSVPTGGRPNRGIELINDTIFVFGENYISYSADGNNWELADRPVGLLEITAVVLGDSYLVSAGRGTTRIAIGLSSMRWSK